MKRPLAPHTTPRGLRITFRNRLAAVAAGALAACALAQAGAIGLDILRNTFDGVASKNYGDAYRDDADKLFHTMTKPAADGIAATHADASKSTAPSNSSGASEPAPPSTASAAVTADATAAPASSTAAPASSAAAPASGGTADSHVDAARAPAAPASSEPAPALALEVSVLKETVEGGRSIPVPIQDGDVLYDRFGSHGAGDNIKFMFRANATAYVYVISIDGTGWIQPIFPGAYAGFTNPVEPNKTYLFPEGSTWAPLDSYRGVEHLYFIASRGPKPDLEKSLALFASRVRDVDASRAEQGPVELAQVTTEAPLSRGFEAPRKSAVHDVPSSAGETFKVDAQLFSGAGPGDIVVTRWFRHQ